MAEIIIAPSLLSANFINLKTEIESCLAAGTDWIHYDVMDRHFVSNLTFGPKILKDIVSEFPQLKLDLHFMVEITVNLQEYLKEYFACQPKSMTMHIESLKKKSNIHQFIDECHFHGVNCTLAISPTTKIVEVVPFLDRLDGVLVMSVKPGFGGQTFMPEVLDKIRFLDAFKKDKALNYDIQVDGGINLETGKLAFLAGANHFVAGNSFFESNQKKVFVETFINYGK